MSYPLLPEAYCADEDAGDGEGSDVEGLEEGLGDDELRRPSTEGTEGNDGNDGTVLSFERLGSVETTGSVEAVEAPGRLDVDGGVGEGLGREPTAGTDVVDGAEVGVQLPFSPAFWSTPETSAPMLETAPRASEVSTSIGHVVEPKGVRSSMTNCREVVPSPGML